MVGRLFGIVTTTPDAGAGLLTGIAAFALATTAVASERASALTSAFTSALAFAAVTAFAAVWLCSLSSFCSSIFNCCLSSAISCSLLLVDSAQACEATRAPQRHSDDANVFLSTSHPPALINFPPSFGLGNEIRNSLRSRPPPVALRQTSSEPIAPAKRKCASQNIAPRLLQRGGSFVAVLVEHTPSPRGQELLASQRSSRVLSYRSIQHSQEVAHIKV